MNNLYIDMPEISEMKGSVDADEASSNKSTMCNIMNKINL